MSYVRETLAATGLDARLLELQMTEDVLLYDTARSLRTLTALKSLGVAISIEAFGTGKASFADLQRFPIDALKLHAARIEGIALRSRQATLRRGRHRARCERSRLSVVATGVASAGRRRVPAGQRLLGVARSDRRTVVVGRRMRGAGARAPLDWRRW